MSPKRILLAHGNGGRLMRELIQDRFARHLGNDLLDTNVDAATLPQIAGSLIITTDGFTVQPLEFPGGDLGSLAVHGVINDLAVAGADPAYLTLTALIEEGLELDQLERLIVSFARAAGNNGAKVVAGDTKVLRQGEGGGLYLSVTGVGSKLPQIHLDPSTIRTGDLVLVSGTIGDHGIAVMLAREEFGLAGDLESDSASVLPLTRAVRELPGLRFMRDPTRGGLATVGQEIANACHATVVLEETRVPLRPQVISVCEMLGYDPYYLACEGRVVAVAAPEIAKTVLGVWRSLPGGANAAICGRVEPGRVRVLLETELGGLRLLDELEDDPLPRIC